MSKSDDGLTWTNEIPNLADLYQFGGRPGCSYLLCDSPHVAEATRAGWRRIVTQGAVAPTFTLIGPTGTCDFELLESGEVSGTIDPQSSAQEALVSTYLLTATGFKEGGTRSDGPSVDVPITATVGKKLGQVAAVTLEAPSA